jgi:glycosyltransferase involved in cell wall biosynthesis
METISDSPRPSVSVVLPTHNRPVWLEQAVRSVLDGEYDDVEVIVSNNGDPAHTLHLREQIDDRRVRWIERAPSGILDNVLSALSIAEGAYVAVLHDDDWWHPKLLATLVPPLDAHPEAVVAFADQWQVDVKGMVDTESSNYFTRSSGRGTLAAGLHQPFTDLAVRESVSFAGGVFRRHALAAESVPSEVGPALDVWNGYLLAAGGGAAYFCPERLVYCRRHADSDFALRSIENLVAAIYCQRRMLADPRMAAHQDELARRLAKRQRWVGASLLRQGSRSEARAHLAAALRIRATAKGVGGWMASWVLPRSMLARL